jgi:aspartate racemase
MEKEFYKSRLAEKFDLDVIVPSDEDRDAVHEIIYKELCNGVTKDESRRAYQEVIGRLKSAGAECLILGCTEIGLLIDETQSELPIFDTARIHAIAAADWAMADTKEQ